MALWLRFTCFNAAHSPSPSDSPSLKTITALDVSTCSRLTAYINGPTVHSGRLCHRRSQSGPYSGARSASRLSTASSLPKRSRCRSRFIVLQVQVSARLRRLLANIDAGDCLLQQATFRIGALQDTVKTCLSAADKLRAPGARILLRARLRCVRTVQVARAGAIVAIPSGPRPMQSRFR
eukprot:3540027-Rhodomonas_salina.2